jgi:hypothetical protein
VVHYASTLPKELEIRTHVGDDSQASLLHIEGVCCTFTAHYSKARVREAGARLHDTQGYHLLVFFVIIFRIFGS